MTDPNDPVFSDKRLGAALNKREYFAAMAMQGMMSLHPKEMLDCCGVEFSSVGAWMAGNAVDAADALIAELNKTPRTE